MSQKLNQALPSVGRELQYIYLVLRTLENKKDTSRCNYSMFQENFILKQFDERLKEVDRSAIVLVDDLVYRLLDESRLNSTNAAITPEFDQYFHYCLFYLYDYAIQLNWHEKDLKETDNSSEVVSPNRKLIYAQDFLAFQERLSKTRATLRSQQNSSPRSIIKSKPSPDALKSPSKSVKSSLVNLGSSNSFRKRVRFSDSPNEENGKVNNPVTQYKGSDSTLALTIFLFGISVFLERLVGQILSWSAKEAGSINLINKFMNSKQKLRSNQIMTLLKQMTLNNDVEIRSLKQMDLILRKYLLQYLVEVVCAVYPERLRNHLKHPLVRVFISDYMWYAESRLIGDIAKQNLQTILDLIIIELNVSPVELSSRKRNKSPNDAQRSYENQKNFITSWLNLDDWLYKPTSRTGSKDNRKSSLSADKFKSSSRILAQIDTLSEFSSLLFNELTAKFSSKTSQIYFLHEVLKGLRPSFEDVSEQLLAQLKASRQVQRSNVGSIKSTETISDLRGLAGSVDSLSAKVRCLKCAHIFSSIYGSIIEIAEKHSIKVPNELKFESRIANFTEQCSKR